MILSDTLKNAINELQTRLVPCTESDNVLLIFDNGLQLKKYKNKNKYLTPDILCATVDDLCHNFLKGRRFKRYVFMKERDIYE